MTDSYLTNPVVFLIQTLFGLYTTIVILRFLLQWMRADFYNPISQFVVKLTTPVLGPLRRVVPGIGGADIASLVLAWLLKSTELILIGLLVGANRNLLGAFFWSLPALVGLVINIFLFAVFIRVILSWVAPDPRHPGVHLLDSLTSPLLRPAQRLLPPIGGIDLSPMLVIIGLVLLRMLLLPPLQALTLSPQWVV
ncbi:putative integral membrane protein [Thioflavicoccus mobilis 8321]|uniref:Putative integral membrane protein n=1 Tax=Thioflavicoccus mobilis 8321 TaxID=765912 RepID=L0GUT5_9GAMM|nr:YggT family protein [Thioflavicoccus mobilis]AGA89587.1 putative integral membrane protein [Thioflavicoccus mobilis 8321]